MVLYSVVNVKCDTKVGNGVYEICALSEEVAAMPKWVILPTN